MSIDVRNGAKVIHSANTFSEAKAWLHSNYNVCHYEDDPEYDDCGDAYLYNGDVIAIQPSDLQVKEWI